VFIIERRHKAVQLSDSTTVAASDSAASASTPVIYGAALKDTPDGSPVDSKSILDICCLVTFTLSSECKGGTAVVQA